MVIKKLILLCETNNKIMSLTIDQYEKLEKITFDNIQRVELQLWKAIFDGEYDKVMMFIDKGVKLNYSHIYIAISHKRLKILKMMINKTKYKITSRALETAVEYNRISIVHYFLSIGADVNEKVLFDIAIQSKNENMIALLIYHGLTMNYLIERLDLSI